MGKHNAIPVEIIEYAREHGSECSIRKMAGRITEVFGRPMTFEQARSMYKNHHIHSSPMKGRKGVSRFPEGMEEYIRSVAEGRPSSEIAALVNERFGEGMITEASLQAYKKNHKIRSGYDARFKKGNISPNKGKHTKTTGRMAETQFKKGARPHNAKPVGSERNLIGYIEVKVGEPNVWKFKHRVIWEEHYGPIPEGQMICFKDGDPLNVDIGNLAMVDKATSLQMSRLGIHSPGKEAFGSAVLAARLYADACQLEKDRKKSKKTKIS